MPLRIGGTAVGLGEAIAARLTECQKERLELLVIACILADNDDEKRVRDAKSRLTKMIREFSLTNKL